MKNKPMVGDTISCPSCNLEFIRNNINRRFCSVECRQKYHHGYKSYSDKNIAKKNKGTYAELAVYCDLLSRGYDVFKNLTPHSAFDLVAYKKEIGLFGVEVKTGFISGDGNLIRGGSLKHKEHDVLAVYLKNNGEIIYEGNENFVPKKRN